MKFSDKIVQRSLFPFNYGYFASFANRLKSFIPRHFFTNISFTPVKSPGHDRSNMTKFMTLIFL